MVVDAPTVTDEVDEDEENNIEIKVQGNDSDSKKTFKISKVILLLIKLFFI